MGTSTFVSPANNVAMDWNWGYKEQNNAIIGTYTGGSGNINGNNFGRASYVREINSVSYTKADDSIHILCPSVLVKPSGITLVTEGVTNVSVKPIRVSSNSSLLPQATTTNVDLNKTLQVIGTIEVVDRGALINDKIPGESGNPWFIDGINLAESYSSQNPKDKQSSENSRAKYRIPLSMKIYPKAFVWRYLNVDGNPIQYAANQQYECDNEILMGGMFVDLSQNCNS